MNEQDFSPQDEYKDTSSIDENYINEKNSEEGKEASEPVSKQKETVKTPVSPITNPQAPHRYQTVDTQVYRQPPGRENSRVYYQHPTIQQPASNYAQSAVRQDDRKPGRIPGVIGFGFASSLLSLFLIPLFRELFPNFLNAYSDPITYDREAYLMYFVMILVYGGVSAMLAVFGLIFAPLGMSRAKRHHLDGQALGTATILISVVSLILLLVSIVSTLLIHNML